MALDISRRQHLQQLLDAYSELLTAHQRETLRLHLDNDWSYAEIAASQKVTRTAVYDLVRRSEAALRNYEAKLGLVAATERREVGRERLDQRLDGLAAELSTLRKAVKGLP